MNGRILVTGSSGALGRRVCACLHAAGASVLGLDARSAPDGRPGWETVRADLLDARALGRALAAVDAVVHTAALHGGHLHHAGPARVYEHNVRATANVVAGCVQHGVRRFVFTSSTSVYGLSARPGGLPAAWVDERRPVRPSDAYDLSKLVGEALCRDAARRGVRVTVLRPSRFDVDDLVAHGVRTLHRGIDVRDAARAHAIAALATDDVRYDVLQISARSPFAPGDLARLAIDAPAVIESHFPGARELFRRRSWTLPRRLDRVYATDRAEHRLGFVARHDFARFLADTTAEELTAA